MAWVVFLENWKHYIDVIMTTMASQITSLMVVYSTVYSDADQRKHQSSTSLAFVWEIHRDRWILRTKGQLRGKYFHLMTSSWVFPSQLRRKRAQGARWWAQGAWWWRQQNWTKNKSPGYLGWFGDIPDSKVHVANMEPTWVLSAPDGPHVGPMNLAIRDVLAITGLYLQSY